MHTSPLFATINLDDNRKIIVRLYIPAEKLTHLLELSKKPDFSKADLVEFTEYDVSIQPGI